VASGSLITAPTPGLYLVGAQLQTTSTAKVIAPTVQINCSTGAQAVGKGPDIIQPGIWRTEDLFELEAGDTLQVSGQISSLSGTKNLDNDGCRFWGTKVGPKRWT
jgi:hypothetical protein